MAAYLRRTTPFTRLAYFMLLLFLCALIYILLLATVLPALTGEALDTLQKHLEDTNRMGYMKLAQFGYTIVVFLVPPVVFAMLTEDRPAQWLGLRGKINIKQAGLAVLALIVITPLVGWTAQWNEHWHVSESMRQMEKQAEALTKAFLAGKTIVDLVLNMAMVALIPALGEEMFFRAGLQKILTELVKNKWVAVLITAIVFSAIHMEFLGFVPRVVLGGLLGAIYAITGRLWLSILAHFINNGIQVAAIWMFNNGILHTDPMGSETVSWYAAVASLFITIFVFVMLQRNTPETAVAPVVPEEMQIGKRPL